MIRVWYTEEESENDLGLFLLRNYPSFFLRKWFSNFDIEQEGKKHDSEREHLRLRSLQLGESTGVIVEMRLLEELRSHPYYHLMLIAKSDRAPVRSASSLWNKPLSRPSSWGGACFHSYFINWGIIWIHKNSLFCVYSSMSFNQHIESYNHPRSQQWGELHYPCYVLGPLCNSCPLPQPLETTGLFQHWWFPLYHSVVEMRSGSMQSFDSSLFHLTLMHLKFICAVACISIHSFVLLSTSPLGGYTTAYWSIHQLKVFPLFLVWGICE